MRSIANAELIAVYAIRLLCWCCADVVASGGALDSKSSFQSRSSDASSSSINSASFSQSLTDGIAQAVVAHDAAAQSTSKLFILN